VREDNGKGPAIVAGGTSKDGSKRKKIGLTDFGGGKEKSGETGEKAGLKAFRRG